MRGAGGSQRRTRWHRVCLVVLVLLGCGLLAPVVGAARGRPPGHARPSTGDTSTCPRVDHHRPPSAVPTTVPVPARRPRGGPRPLTTLPPGGGFTSLSCISDTFCVAAGGGTTGDGTALTSGSGVAVSWDGAAWSDPVGLLPGAGHRAGHRPGPARRHLHVGTARA